MFPISFFWRAAAKFSDRVALAEGEISLTYGELADRVRACSAAYNALDANPRSRVAICMGNTIEHVIALLGVLACGKTWIPLSPRNGNDELNRIISFTRPSIVVQDAAASGRLLSDSKDVIFLQASAAPDSTVLDFDALLRQHQADPLPEIYATLDEPQAIKFTGGTTGTPKGVVQPFRAWNLNVVTQLVCFGYNADERYLAVGPLTHGTSTFLLPILSQGGQIVFPRHTSPGAILEEIGERRITCAFMPPTLLYALLAEQQRSPRDTSSLRHLIYTAAPMRPEEIEGVQRVFGPIISSTYGQTEAPLIATFIPADELAKPGLRASVGKATILTDVAVVDQTGNSLPAGTVGEIAIRGDLVMTGYFQMPEATAQVIRNGWLLTGDVGHLDENGYLFLKGRSRDVMITGGFNVYPSDVENALSKHPAIYDCSVVGIPDSHWGEAVHAAVQLRAGLQASEDEIIRFVKDALDSVKAPKAVHFLQELPRNSLGKTMKSEIVSHIQRRMRVGSSGVA